MNRVFLFIFAYILCGGLKIHCSENPQFSESKYYCPAEFERIDAVWIAFSKEGAKIDFPYRDTQLEVIEHLAPHTIHLLFQGAEDLTFFLSTAKEKALDISHCRFFIQPFETIWLRDTAPTFLKNKTDSCLKSVRFGFNEWGYAERELSVDSPVSLDTNLCASIAKHLHIPMEQSKLVGEGGNHEVNGKGTLICVEAVERNRNPLMTKKEMEEAFRKSLKIKKVIWLPYGLVEDGYADATHLKNRENSPFYYTPFTPGGHIDEFCRFADEHTLLLMEVIAEKNPLHPIELENKKRLEEIYSILQKETDQDGKPFRIIRVPSPVMLFDRFTKSDPFYYFFQNFSFIPTKTFPEGTFPKQDEYPIIPSLSYLNFLICNDRVLIPRYWREGMLEDIRIRDQEVMDIFQAVFPDKRIYSIDVYSLNLAGGGIHCMTQFQPYTECKK